MYCKFAVGWVVVERVEDTSGVGDRCLKYISSEEIYVLDVERICVFLSATRNTNE